MIVTNVTNVTNVTSPRKYCPDDDRDSGSQDLDKEKNFRRRQKESPSTNVSSFLIHTWDRNLDSQYRYIQKKNRKEKEGEKEKKKGN
jgi:hypothetical protein